MKKFPGGSIRTMHSTAETVRRFVLCNSGNCIFAGGR